MVLSCAVLLSVAEPSMVRVNFSLVRGFPSIQYRCVCAEARLQDNWVGVCLGAVQAMAVTDGPADWGGSGWLGWRGRGTSSQEISFIQTTHQAKCRSKHLGE
jgi:hypothetical protein